VDAKLDPMTFTVLAKRFDMVGAAMIDTGLMSARSSLLNAIRDFSTGIYDATPQVVSQAVALPGHTCGTHLLVETIAQAFQGDIRPGDMLLSNSPFRGGAHVSDLTFCAPVFVDEEHLLWSVCRGHQADVGSFAPGTMWLYTDMYKEGVHIPPLRIERHWKPIKDVVSFYFENIRYRDRTEGDFWAMVASARVGERRLVELCHEYGKDVIKQFIQQYLDYADDMMAAEVRSIPDGEVEAEAENDPDVYGQPIRVRCRLIKKDDLITVDLSQSSEQVAAYNGTYACSMAAVGYSIGYCIDPRIPKNAGFLRHIKMITQPGTVCHPLPPAASFMATTYVPDCISNAIFKCLMQLAPEKATAGWSYLVAGGGLGPGIDRRGKTPTLVGGGGSLGFSGSGALKGYDGWPCVCTPAAGGGLILADVEITEYQLPNMVRQKQIWTDGAGDGQWRGGWGVAGMTQPVLSERESGLSGGGGEYIQGQAFGAKGGTAAPPIYGAKMNLVTGEISHPARYAETMFTTDEAAMLGAPGGGGWGDPLDRDPELVRKDARNQIISRRRANKVYGVVLNMDTELWDVDYPATAKLRQETRQRRPQQPLISATASDEWTSD